MPYVLIVECFKYQQLEKKSSKIKELMESMNIILHMMRLIEERVKWLKVLTEDTKPVR